MKTCRVDIIQSDGHLYCGECGADLPCEASAKAGSAYEGFGLPICTGCGCFLTSRS